MFDASSRATASGHHRAGSGGAHDCASETRGCRFALGGGFAIGRRCSFAGGSRVAEQCAGRCRIAQRGRGPRCGRRCRGTTHRNPDQSRRDG